MAQVETIAQVLTTTDAGRRSARQTSNAVCRKPSTTLATSQQEVISFREMVTQQYTPEIQPLCAYEPLKCYLGAAPALGKISRVIGAKFAVAWLMSQIDYYSRTLNTADQMTEDDTQHLALTILGNYPHLNLAEVMLFFSRLSGGIYGQVAYGQVRAENITAKIPEFLKHRARELDRHKREQQQLEREAEERRRAQYAISYDEWQRIKADVLALCNGDKQAAEEYINRKYLKQ